MKRICEYLYKLGFTEIEAKMYVRLLRSGPLTVAELAEKAQINRTAAYAHINALYSTKSQQKDLPSSEMKYYKGIGVKAIYEEVLKSDKIRAYFDPIDLDQVFPENPKLFNDAIKNNPRMLVFELLAPSSESIRLVKEAVAVKRHIYKFLPNDIKLTSNDILIFDGKVAIINIGDKDNVSGVVLENRDYYNNSVQLFDLLWRLLPEQK